jgi:hypothetical protein
MPHYADLAPAAAIHCSRRTIRSGHWCWLESSVAHHDDSISSAVGSAIASPRRSAYSLASTWLIQAPIRAPLSYRMLPTWAKRNAKTTGCNDPPSAYNVGLDLPRGNSRRAYALSSVGRCVIERRVAGHEGQRPQTANPAVPRLNSIWRSTDDGSRPRRNEESRPGQRHPH